MDYSKHTLQAHTMKQEQKSEAWERPMSYNDYREFREQSFWADFEEMRRLDSEKPVKVSKLSYLKVKHLIAVKQIRLSRRLAQSRNEVHYLPHQSDPGRSL